MYVFIKGSSTSGNHGHAGIIGTVGGSAPTGVLADRLAGEIIGGRVPARDRVWQGVRQEGHPVLTGQQYGKLGEKIASEVLSQVYGETMQTANQGRNNAPVDLVSENLAVEVKTSADTTNEKSQVWKAHWSSSSQQEKELRKTLSPEAKKKLGDLQNEQVLIRKNSYADELERQRGHPVQRLMVGLIMNSNFDKADVFRMEGFRLRAPWKQYATEENYIGTYKVKGKS